MTVPYTFANNYGNIPLSELDDNFASCKAFADTAGLVTEAVQPAITSVGILTSLSVSGNIVGNVNASIYRGTTVSVTGNITGGNIITSGNINTGSNIIATGNLSVSQITTNSDVGIGGLMNVFGNVSAGNLLTSGQVIATGNIRTVGIVSASGNIIGNNISSTNTLQGNLLVTVPVYANITANATTYGLSTTNSLNILIANNTGYTVTLDMPALHQDGQICDFAVHGNTMTLVKGIGNVLPTFAGSATVGTNFKYVYRSSNNSWYKI